MRIIDGIYQVTFIYLCASFNLRQLGCRGLGMCKDCFEGFEGFELL